MNLSELFIRRPVMTTLIMIAIVIFGLMSYVSLPISALPNVEFPFISVLASLPGATPETMASAVAAPLERQFTEIAGLNSFNSTSSTGSANISLQFDFSRNVDDAAKDVQAAISAASGQLPTGMPRLPSYRKLNPSVAPVLYLYLYSQTLPISTVDEYAETTLAQPISAINGVAQVQVYGQKQYAVRVQVDPQTLAARQIGINQLRTAIQAGNVTLPTGSLSDHYKTYWIQANGQLQDAEGFRQLILTQDNGAVVRLGDVATVVDSIQNNKVENRFSDRKIFNQPAVVLAVQPEPGGNTVKIVDIVKQMLPTLRGQVPQAIEMGILYDRSISVRDSIHDVQFTLLLSIALVVLVIFLFLRDVNATLIPSLALPIAIIGTFAVMYLLGFSLNNISLMALTLSVGFVVDDAIVVLENIVRHRELGEPPLQAALNGSREISFTILSMTLSLIAVFIPILLMGGIVGRLFHEFAVTISVAILVSGFVSLTLTPMLCSRFLRSQHQRRHRILQLFEWGFERCLRGYAWSLQPILHHRWVTLLGSAILLFLTMQLFAVVPKGFIPNEDTGQIMVNTKAAQDISFQDMLRHQQQVVDIILKDPNVAALTSLVGAAGPNASVNSGRMNIRLKPRSQRQKTADEIIQDLTPKLRRVIGLRTFLRSPTAIPIGGQQTNSQYQFTLQSLDIQALRQALPAFMDMVRALPGLTGVDSDLQLNTPQVEVEIDHAKAATLGISAADVQRTLGAAYGSGQVSTIYNPNDQFYVILEVQPEDQKDPNALSLLYVQSQTGKTIPLSAIATMRQTVGPLTVNHLSGLPSVTISFDTTPGVSLSQARQAILAAAQTALPPTITATFQGSAQAFEQSTRDSGWLLLTSILVIYLILGILYEDLIHPLTILSGLPSAGFGALLTLMIFNVELNLYSFIGLILLVGIVKKNGIMLVDFAIAAQRQDEKSPLDAIYAACLVRFRPIMMTTMAALIGTLPIAIGAGSGSEARRPLGIAIVGGLICSQVLTLYLTPVFYLYFESLRTKYTRWGFIRH